MIQRPYSEWQMKVWQILNRTCLLKRPLRKLNLSVGMSSLKSQILKSHFQNNPWAQKLRNLKFKQTLISLSIIHLIPHTIMEMSLLLKYWLSLLVLLQMVMHKINLLSKAISQLMQFNWKSNLQIDLKKHLIMKTRKCRLSIKHLMRLLRETRTLVAYFSRLNKLMMIT